MCESWAEHDIPEQKDRVAVVTGANRGSGFETARILAVRGASVVLAVRDVEKGKHAAMRITQSAPTADLAIQQLDLTSLESIRAAAAKLQTRHPKIDLLINNAGVMYTPSARPETDSSCSSVPTTAGISHSPGCCSTSCCPCPAHGLSQ